MSSRMVIFGRRERLWAAVRKEVPRLLMVVEQVCHVA
jgi:hypothetical protein